MRLTIIGQQAFGAAVLKAFVARGHEIAAVFTAPESPGSKPNPLSAAALERGLPVLAFAGLALPEAREALARLEVELGVMAYVTQFAPQSFCTVPRHGMLQFHPSLLPQHRGPSAINWAIIRGRRKTGLSIFRPVDGLDEGPIVLQREVEIAPDDTVGSVYFEKIFPLGVEALVEAAEAVVGGSASETPQDETAASYEGWVREGESRLDWSKHVTQIYDLIRGCNPSPGAWTRWNGRRLQIFDARRRVASTFAAVRGLRPGEVTAVTAESFTVHAPGGFIEVLRCRLDDGPKISGGALGIAAGTLLGS